MFRFLLQRFQKPQVKEDDDSPDTLYLYKRLLGYIRPYWFRFVASMIITIPIGGMDAAIALSLKPYLDGMTVQKSVQNVNALPLIIVGLTAIQGIMSYFSIYLNGWLSFHITNDIRNDLYRKLLSMEIRYFDKITSGVIIQRYFKDPEALQTNLLDNTKTMLTRFFSSVALIGALIYTSWQLSIVAVSILVLILYPSTRIRKLIKDLAKELTLSGAGLLSMYTDTVGGARVIYGYNLFRHQLRKYEDIQRSMYDRTMKKVKAQGWMTPSMHIIASIGIALIIWQGSKMVVEGELTTGALVSFLAAMIMLYNPIKNLGNSLMNAQMSMLATGRVFEIMDMVPAIQDKPEAVVLRQMQTGIRFENVLFSYGSVKRPVMRSFNLTINKGESVALVGSSGSGKTTVVNLIPRFYDVQEGQITIDGVDIRDYQLESLRKNIALVMQDNFLFNGSIRDNIALGKPQATEREILDAVEKAYLNDFLTSLNFRGSVSLGLDTEIGERGIMLSGGQRQRVAIARALLKDAPIVILDEATSTLDNQSEAIVQKAIETLMENRTVIVIAHRLSTIRNVDRIVVLESGKVIEEGSHEALLAANGTYTALYNTQFSTQEATILTEPAVMETVQVQSAQPAEPAVPLS